MLFFSPDRPSHLHPSLPGYVSLNFKVLAWTPLSLWWELVILPRCFPFRPESLEPSFRKFRGLFIFLEVNVSINVDTKKNVGGFD
jgi:hypothetical protein